MTSMNIKAALMNKKPAAGGQVFVLLTVAIPVLLMLTGMALDYGTAYVDRTALSKAVDAAALEGMRNLGQGSAIAKKLAADTFNSNVEVLGSYGVPPTFNFSQNTDANGNLTVTITGTVFFSPIFLRFLPGFPSQIPIAQSGTASRQPLYMALVLDQSYSMTQNGGANALPSAVTNFVNQFDDTLDHVAVVSFATIATVGVKMSSTPPFKAAVKNYVNNMQFTLDNAFTFAQTGLDNGLAQINSVALPPNAAKIMVFFTDGWPNMVQDGLNCNKNSNARTTLNFSMCDQGDVSLGLCPNNFPLAVYGTDGSSATCGTPNPPGPTCNSYPSFGLPIGCASPPGWLTFHQQKSNAMVAPSMTAISDDAFYRAENSATTALNQNVQIYSIGLGNAITGQPTAKDFLYQVANDPNSATFNANLPQGQALFTPTASQLDTLFQQIASKILLRLSQ